MAETEDDPRAVMMKRQETAYTLGQIERSTFLRRMHALGATDTDKLLLRLKELDAKRDAVVSHADKFKNRSSPSRAGVP